MSFGHREQRLPLHIPQQLTDHPLTSPINPFRNRMIFYRLQTS